MALKLEEDAVVVRVLEDELGGGGCRGNGGNGG